MTPAQIAINAKAVRAGADRLESAGYEGDAHHFVEALLVEAFAAGFRPIEPPVPDKPLHVATDAQRQKHIDDAKALLAAAKHREVEGR